MISLGELVQLKSGGPCMTAGEKYSAGIRCVWAKGDEIQQKDFDEEVLKLWEAPVLQSPNITFGDRAYDSLLSAVRAIVDKDAPGSVADIRTRLGAELHRLGVMARQES